MKILSEQEQRERAQLEKEKEREHYLLDQYAGQAMRGLLAANSQLRAMDKITGTVKLSWDIAEAMLKERAARQKQAAQ